MPLWLLQSAGPGPNNRRWRSFDRCASRARFTVFEPAAGIFVTVTEHWLSRFVCLLPSVDLVLVLHGMFPHVEIRLVHLQPTGPGPNFGRRPCFGRPTSRARVLEPSTGIFVTVPRILKNFDDCLLWSVDLVLVFNDMFPHVEIRHVLMACLLSC